jgi:hypothetical protein
LFRVKTYYFPSIACLHLPSRQRPISSPSTFVAFSHLIVRPVVSPDLDGLCAQLYALRVHLLLVPDRGQVGQERHLGRVEVDRFLVVRDRRLKLLVLVGVVARLLRGQGQAHVVLLHHAARLLQEVRVEQWNRILFSQISPSFAFYRFLLRMLCIAHVVANWASKKTEQNEAKRHVSLACGAFVATGISLEASS